MKKVFFITNKLSGGGAERVMSVLANYFVRDGINVEFLVLSGDTSSEYKLDEKIKLEIFKKKGKHNVIGQIKFIRKCMKKNPNSTFISFFTHQNLYTILASIGLNEKVIVSERNDPAKSINGRLKKILRKVLYSSKNCNRIIFQTPDARNYFSKKIQLKGKIIANPLKENLPSAYNGQREKTIVSFGRFEPQKNYTLLINSFSKFLRVYNDYKLILYGRGSQERELKELVNNLGIEDKVVFPGFDKNIHEKIIKSGMFVLPSNYEGLSNSMLEAMAIGLPVICTDCPCGGARMFIENKKNGILIPVGDEKSMIEAMTFYAKDTECACKIGKKASEIKSELCSENICRLWEKEILEEDL